MSDSGVNYAAGSHKLAGGPRLRLDEDKQGATLVSSEGLELWHYNFEELVQLHNQVSDVWRLAHAARRTEQAKEDLI